MYERTITDRMTLEALLRERDELDRSAHTLEIPEQMNTVLMGLTQHERLVRHELDMYYHNISTGRPAASTPYLYRHTTAAEGVWTSAKIYLFPFTSGLSDIGSPAYHVTLSTRPWGLGTVLEVFYEDHRPVIVEISSHAENDADRREALSRLVTATWSNPS